MVFLQLWYAFQTFDWDEVPNLPSTTIWFFNRRVLPETVVHSFFLYTPKCWKNIRIVSSVGVLSSKLQENHNSTTDISLEVFISFITNHFQEKFQ